MLTALQSAWKKWKWKRKVSTPRKKREETSDFAVDVIQRYDKGGTPDHISNFLSFSCSTIGTIFKDNEEEEGGGEGDREEGEEKEEEEAAHKCSQQQSLKSALYVLE